jgi:sulfite oxidase
VYDVTDFIPLHPGADKLLLAAGGSIEPFWDILAVHKENQAIHNRLESYRIGNLKDEIVAYGDDDPYKSEPKRNNSLVIRNHTPYVGETPVDVLCGDFITPTELFFVRNHLPVPEIDLSDYGLEISGNCLIKKRLVYKKFTFDPGIGVEKQTFSMDDIKQLPAYTITATLQGAANRRDELCEVCPLPFIKFSGGCCGTAAWKGTKLVDVLKAAGLDDMKDDCSSQHVLFEGLDTGPAGSHYSVSIPIQKALDQYGDVLLAYEMNGEPLTPDHG